MFKSFSLAYIFQYFLILLLNINYSPLVVNAIKQSDHNLLSVILGKHVLLLNDLHIRKDVTII
ncbi:hypothetical protein GCM10008934_28820 [Virgibacillus salarius]